MNEIDTELIKNCSDLERLLKLIKYDLRDNPFWNSVLDTIIRCRKVSIHLAILIQPYLEYILEGKKTVESRFSKNKIAPYKKIDKGDIILLKKSGGLLMGICYVEEAWFYQLDPKSWAEIKANYTNAICAQEPEFWIQRENATYASLIRVSHPTKIHPIHWIKKDRRGWVVLHERRKLQPLSSWFANGGY